MGKVGVYLLVIFSVSNVNSLESQPIEVPSQSSYNKHPAHRIQYDSTLLKTVLKSSRVLVNSQKNDINGPKISESLVVNYKADVLDGQVKSDNTPPCGLGQKYKIRYPGSCQKYYECDNGTLVTMSCYWLTNFDVIEQCCRFYYFVDCTITEPPATPSSTVDTTTSIISTQTSTISNETTSSNGSTSFASTSPVSTTTSNITSVSQLTSISSTLRPTTHPIISSSQTPTEIPSTSTTTNPTTTTTKSTTIMASTSESTMTPLPTSTAPQTSTSYSTVSTSPPTSSSQTIPSTVTTSTGVPITKTTFFTTDLPIPTSTSTLSTSSPATISVTTKETDSPTSYPSTTAFPYDPRCSPGQYYKKRFPNDCQKFYWCRNGSLEIWICNTFYNFDAKTLACKIFWEVDCSIGM